MPDAPQHRPVDRQQSFPALEEEVLARWRERDVFPESLRRREGRRAVGLLRGPADGQRPARLPPRARARVQGHLPALQDDARLCWSSARAAGTATACRSRSRSRSSSGSSPRRRSRPTASPSSTPAAASRCSRSWRTGTALTERIGFWIDLDDAYRTLDNDYIESVWWALRQIWDKDLLYEGHKVVPYCPRCGTALSSHEVALGYKDVVDPSVYVRFRSPPHRPAARRRRAARVDDDAVDAGVQRRGGGRPRADLRARARRPSSCSPRRWSSACSARAPRSSTASRAPRWTACATSRRSPTSAPRSTASAGHTVAARRLRHRRGRHRPRPHGDRLRRGRLPARRAVRAQRRQPGAARRHLRRAHRPLRGALRQGRRRRPDRGPARARPAAARRGLRALLPALLALRHAAALLRQAVLVHRHLEPARPAAGRQRDGRLAPRAHQARALRRSGWRTTSTGRCRASATGARRCPSGAAATATPTASGPSTSSRSSRACGLEDPHRPFVDEVDVPVRELRRRHAPRARGHRRVVRLGLRCRSPSTTRPFENQEQFEQRFPADFICEALDQTRGWFYSLLAVSTLLFDRSPYENVVCLGLILDAEGQKMSKSRATSSCPGT